MSAMQEKIKQNNVKNSISYHYYRVASPESNKISMIKLSYLCSKRNYTTGRSAHKKIHYFLPMGRYSIWSALSLRTVTDWSYTGANSKIFFRYPFLTQTVHC